VKEPLIRALTTQAALQAVDAMAPHVRAKILEDAGDIDEARRAFAFTWIPLRLQMRMLEAMRRHLAPSDWQRSQQNLMLAYLERPVMRGLFDMAVRVFGLSVDTCARWCPRAYAALFQGAGQITYEAGAREHEAVLILDGFPPDLFASGTFAEAVQFSIETMCPLSRTTGSVEMSELDRARGHAEYLLRWNAG
jgi:hypothetical protein